ncbi:hypothetical protein DRE_07333 [Drechslerella stenobrocha 248]|uniref:Uncharacterized protein n=1 Tax=Drechslerella stenobrocha 248 TaxID=1043628 RepID=W7HV65_9PEZI|nr:hypothetical protein DRE_07333 [Drechslerella stenobrocha 248]
MAASTTPNSKLPYHKLHDEFDSDDENDQYPLDTPKFLWPARLAVLTSLKGLRRSSISRALMASASLIAISLLVYIFSIRDRRIVVSQLSPIDAETLDDRPLILYAYSETDNARENALFFIKHGLHDAANFIFILNGENTIEEEIPNEAHIAVIERKNECYDLGAYSEVLTANNNSLVNSHKRFILLNASIRGPFLPTWSNQCWSEAYLNKVTDTIKLVGMSFNCQAPRGPHVQSMILATDRVGIDILLNDVIAGHCYSGWDDAVDGETNITQAIRQAGYHVTTFMTPFSSVADYPDNCEHGDILWNDKYFGTNMHPYEAMFQKANRDIYPDQLRLLTEWHNKANYSSQPFCGAGRQASS